MESESGTTNTKISDSGYSNSCSNSNSQRRYHKSNFHPKSTKLNFFSYLIVPVQNHATVEATQAEVADTVELQTQMEGRFCFVLLVTPKLNVWLFSVPTIILRHQANETRKKNTRRKS